MKLKAIQVKAALPKDKPYKLSDGYGLYLLVHPTGRKYWRYNYRFQKKHKTLALGTFPEVSLLAARKAHMRAKLELEDGFDPGIQKKINKALRLKKSSNSFESIAKEWVEKQRHVWAPSHTKNIEGRLNNYVYEFIGYRPIDQIEAPELLIILQRIEASGYFETAHRVRALCGQIFRYAIATGRAKHDISADLKGALTPVKKGRFAAITEPELVGKLLQDIEEYHGSFITQCALKLAAYTFVRPGELRFAEWSEINYQKKLWKIPGERMKMGDDHIVPLSTQALDVLLALSELTGEGKYLFPAMTTATRPMSENTVNTALRRMGYSREEMTGHGFRAMASTLLNEKGYNEDWIEVQLAHAQRNKVRAAYNRAKYLPQRTDMMQQWADYLDSLNVSK